ncbi:MAG: hypothetical protein IJR03_03730 [Bacteroidales bacterium]|nr:hypothetical protein [Bacteroidales bacterium]
MKVRICDEEYLHGRFAVDIIDFDSKIKQNIENMYLYYYADLNTTSINNILSQDSLIYTDIFSHSNFSRASLSQDFSSSFYGVSYAIDSSSAVSINSLYSKTILYPITKKR